MLICQGPRELACHDPSRLSRPFRGRRRGGLLAVGDGVAWRVGPGQGEGPAEGIVAAAAGAELPLHRLAEPGAHDGRSEPPVGDAEAVEAAGLQAVAVVLEVASGHTRRRPLTLPPCVTSATRCRSSAARPIAVQPALPTWAGPSVSSPSTWKIPCQVVAGRVAVTAPDPSGVARAVVLASVQPAASRHATVTILAAVGPRPHIRNPVLHVLYCMGCLLQSLAWGSMRYTTLALCRLARTMPSAAPKVAAISATGRSSR